MTYEELLDRLPDDATIPVAIVRQWFKELREQHDNEIEDVVKQTWLLRDLRDVRRERGEAIN